MLGSYSVSTASGAIVATGSAGALIWCCRFTDAEIVAEVERLRVNAVVVSTITVAVPYDLAVYRATGFTVPPANNKTDATLTGINGARSSSYGTTRMTGIHTLQTQAAGMTGDTKVLDDEPLARVSGATGTVIGTQFFGGMVTLLEKTLEPIVLAANEGLSLVAVLAGPATGTFRVVIGLDWKERTKS